MDNKYLSADNIIRKKLFKILWQAGKEIYEVTWQVSKSDD